MNNFFSNNNNKGAGGAYGVGDFSGEEKKNEADSYAQSSADINRAVILPGSDGRNGDS